MRLGPPALCPVLPAGRLVSDLDYQTCVQYCQRAGFTSSLGHEACILCCLQAPCKACIRCCRLAWALEVYPVLPAGRFGFCRVPVSCAASAQVGVPPSTCYRQADLPEIWAGAARGSADLPSEWGCVLCSQWAGWRAVKQLYPVLPAGRLLRPVSSAASGLADLGLRTAGTWVARPICCAANGQACLSLCYQWAGWYEAWVFGHGVALRCCESVGHA